jgi:hypothetical protein
VARISFFLEARVTKQETPSAWFCTGTAVSTPQSRCRIKGMNAGSLHMSPIHFTLLIDPYDLPATSETAKHYHIPSRGTTPRVPESHHYSHHHDRLSWVIMKCYTRSHQRSRPIYFPNPRWNPEERKERYTGRFFTSEATVQTIVIIYYHQYNSNYE